MSSDLIPLPPAQSSMSPAAPAARPAPGKGFPAGHGQLLRRVPAPAGERTGKGEGTAHRGTPYSAGEPAAVRAAASRDTQLPPAPHLSLPEPSASPRGITRSPALWPPARQPRAPPCARGKLPRAAPRTHHHRGAGWLRRSSPAAAEPERARPRRAPRRPRAPT